MNAKHGWTISTMTFFIALLFVSSAAAQETDKPEHRAEADVTYHERLSLGQGVTLARMTNGLTVIVRENHAAPIATVRCYVDNTGSVYEGQWLGAGLSHLVEHLVSGGTTKKRSEAEIRELIDSLGGSTNAFTSNNMTAYYIDCPSKRVDLAIELIADTMQYVTFEQKEYLRELGVVQRELEMGEADRDRVLYQATKQLVFTRHPMRHPIIGYLSVLQKITRDDVIAFYKQRYVPQNMVFVVAGDVKTDKVLDEALKNFKTFHRSADHDPVLADEPDQASPRSARIEMEGQTSRYLIAWPTVPLQHPDLYALDVASYLLTNGDSSRLTKRLRVDEPLAVGVDSASYTPGFVKGWFQVEVECQGDNVEKCRKAILEEITRLANQEVSEKELDKVKRQKSAEHVFGQLTVQAQADSLARSFLSTGDPLFDEQYVKGIQRVTPKQIQAVVRKYLRPERENTAVIVPIGSGGPDAGGTDAQSVESDIVKKKLSNGLTVLIKRHSVQPMVSMQAFARAGILADTDETSGRSALAAELMTKGTEKYTAEEIAEYFDSVGGSLSVNSQRNSTYLTSAVLKDDFPKALDYASQVLFHPTFPADHFKKQQQLQLARIAARKGNPQAEVLDFWTKQLPKTTPFHRTVLGTPETVSKLTVSNLKEFHDQYFVPGNLVLAIFGDIDVDKTLKMVEEKFGGQRGGAIVFRDFPESHTSNTGKQATLRNQQQSSMVLMSYPTISVTDTKTSDALSVLSGVLTGGGGAGGRLFEELRGARLVYYVFGFEMTGFAPGYYLFLAQTRPETADEVAQRIKANLDKIRKEGIPQEEFDKVKQKLIANNSLRNTTPVEQAFQAALNELYGLGYDYDQSYDERIGKVTVKDVQAVVQKYFNNPLVITSQPLSEAASSE